MSEESTEHRPLLCEDLSEEERFPDLPRRYRRNYRGRARFSAKGATAIITRWPEHWSSSLKYLWIGLSIMALTFFLIYNTLIAFVVLPTVNTKPASLRATNQEGFNAPSCLPEIFMHFFVNTDEDANLDKYMPYIEAFADKNCDYTFNLVILFNDTGHKTHSAEENNEIALNSLWSKQHFYKQKQNPHQNIKIKQVALSQFMDKSPIIKHWKHVPAQLIGFLVKALSIWDKGGVAINPEILTPRTPNALYMEKLQHVLNKFKKQRENVQKEPKLKKIVNKHKDKFRKRVNNIRDIINILEHEDDIKVNMNNHISQENLTEAESINIPVVSWNDPKLYHKTSTLKSSKNDSKLSLPTIIELPKFPLLSTINDTNGLDEKQYHLSHTKSRGNADVLEEIDKDFDIIEDNNEPRLSLFPFFLEFLFHDKPKAVEPKGSQENTSNLDINHKTAITKEKSKRNISILPNSNDTNTVENFKPMIIPAKGIVPERLLKDNNTKPAIDIIREVNPEELTIDLKGNILATKASCHAFIGTLFNNVIHHPPGETLQDFIIRELSHFCKGLLSSCRGVDVILV